MGNTPSNPSLKVTPQDKAILQMKVQRDNLTNTSRKLSIIIRKETQIAKDALAKNDRRTALLALKKKKFQESSINRINEQLLTLETLISTVEFKLVEKDFLYGLTQGNELLKNLNKELSLEKVDKIMDSSEAGIQYQEEVDAELSRNLNRSDETEVDAELEAMIKEQNKAAEGAHEQPSLPEAPKTEIMPDVPTHDIDDRREEEPEVASETRARGPALLSS